MIALILATLAIILAYLVYPYLGLVTVLATLLVIGLKRDRSLLEKLLAMLLVTMPLYMIPIIPSLHHIASWTTILLLVLMIQVCSHIRRFSPIGAIMLLLTIGFTVVTGISTTDGDKSWYYPVQFLMFVVPPVLVYEARAWVGSVLDSVAVNRLVVTLASVQLALASGVLVQWLLYSRFGISIGSIGFFLGRVSFDLTISAYSVLSSLLSVGMVLVLTLWRYGHWKTPIILAVVSVAAIIINSSRTGAVVGIAVLGLALLFPPKRVRRFGVRLAVIPVALLGWWILDSFAATRLQNSGLTGLFDDNGRLASLSNAISRLSVLGVGYADYEGLAPHNFAVQTFTSSGLIVGTCIMLFVIGLLWYIRGTHWQYPVWALLGGAMLFSGFYQVKAAIVITILILVLRATDEHNETVGKSLEQTSNNESIQV